MKAVFVGSQNIMDPAMNGGMQCSRRNYDLLCGVLGEENVYSAIIWNSTENRERNRYFRRNVSGLESLAASLCMCRLYRPSEEKKLLEYIHQIGPDVLYLDTSLMGKILKRLDPRIRTVVFMHNVEREYAWNRVRKVSLRYFPAFLAAAYNESIAVKSAGTLVCLNSRDAAKVRKLYKRNPDYLLPISFQDTFDPGKITRTGEDRTLLFVGSNFPPNLDGVGWFIDEVMPELPEYKLLVVGKDFERNREELLRENVEIAGTVKCVENYYYRYSSIVMPIRYGDGMKVKTAEAMMYGMNLFATDEALEGYDVDGAGGIYRCNTKEEFVRAIRGHAQQRRMDRWNRDARERFTMYYDTEKQRKVMANIIYGQTRN